MKIWDIYAFKTAPLPAHQKPIAYFCTVGKGLFSILVCILFFFCVEEAQGCAWIDGENAAVLVSKAHKEVLTASTDSHPSAIEEKAKQLAPASRCCHVVKYVSSNGINLLFSGTYFLQVVQCNGGFQIAQSNHLSHIYPFHNFW